VQLFTHVAQIAFAHLKCPTVGPIDALAKLCVLGLLFAELTDVEVQTIRNLEEKEHQTDGGARNCRIACVLGRANFLRKVHGKFGRLGKGNDAVGTSLPNWCVNLENRRR
jgi:hypothetical protein